MASVAANIAARFSEDCSSPITAHASGATITFTTKNAGVAIENIKVTTSWDQGDFQFASFIYTPPPAPVQPNFVCSPGTIVSGQNVTCAIVLAAGASSPVSISIGGVTWQTVAPDPTSGLAVADGVVTEAQSAQYEVDYSYPGDPSASLPASTGSTQLTVNTPGTPAASNVLYQYQIIQPGGGTGYDAAGNVVGYVDSVNGAWALGYDSLSRLTSSVEAPVSGGPQYGCWNYDSFGNLLGQTLSSQPVNASNGSCQPQSSAINLQGTFHVDVYNQIATTQYQDAAKNTHSGSPQYDSAGEMTNDLLNQYLYDADGMVCAVQTGPGTYVGYMYDAEGHRVAKGTLPSLTCDSTQLQITSMYFIGPDGETLTETDAQGNRVRTMMSAAGMQLATYTPGAVHYPLADWLGTKRVVVNPGSNLSNGVEQTCTSNPFGDGLNCTTALDDSPRHFTGKERDAESGLDYFGARYYASSMGRWMSPDLVNITEERMMNPSSTLNKYAYAANNPLKFVDPDGQDITYFYDQGGFAGHAVLFAYNPVNNDSAIESFGPASKSVGYRMAEPFMPVPGTGMFDMSGVKSADDLRSTYASMTIQTTPELTQQVIDFIRANPDPKMWDVMGPNCSSEVWKILKKFKLDNQHHDHNQGMTPKMLWGDLALRYNVNAYGINPQNGKDYGAPRFDMYNLMWMTIQGSSIQGSVTTSQQDSKDGVPIQPCGGDNPCNR